MPRNEEIQKLIDEETGINNYGSSDYQVGVSDGVRLADKTMIEKVCNWLEDTDFDMEYWNSEDGFCKLEFINDLRKVMEE